jgi:UDP-N-acetylglucosamine 2-epimerase (non-hydrolysing)
MNIDIIAGARPNFVKISSVIDSIKNAQKLGGIISFRLIHTGQHFDKKMSAIFFEQLSIPEPCVNFEVGKDLPVETTSRIMQAYEEFLTANQKPNLCLVFGDVNSTMACAIVAKKMNIKVAHIEAGIRSGDRSMPEEINRIVTDSIADYFYTTSKTAGENLMKSGTKKENIIFVGNTMIDTLLKNKSNFFTPQIWKTLQLKKNNYFVLTLHRPENVDHIDRLKEILQELINNNENIPFIFPIHPRTMSSLRKFKIETNMIHFIEPMSYLEFIFLIQNAKGVITDSGGITEETTVLGIPCITLRNSTERPETVTIGTNEVIGTDPKEIKKYLKKILSNSWKTGEIPEKWDGKSADRIIEHILSLNINQF